MSQLHELSEGVWSQPSSIRVGLFALPRRSVIARLPSGGLFVHSPNALDEALRVELAQLGDVEHVVAPNLLHHAHLADWRAAYPRAIVHGAPGLAAKKRELVFDRVLGPEPDPAWSGVFDQRLVTGAPRLGETLFLHRPSRTLVLTDLAFHIGAEASFGVRLMMRLNGRYGEPGPTRVLKTYLEDRGEVRRVLLDVCDSWDFERVHVAHGEPLEHGRAALRAAYADLR